MRGNIPTGRDSAITVPEHEGQRRAEDETLHQGFGDGDSVMWSM